MLESQPCLANRPIPCTVLKVEKSEFCQSVIRQRIADGLADDGKIFGDIVSCSLHEPVDGFIGGFPCQGVSRAGNGGGLTDGRTCMVRHVWRLWDAQVQQGHAPSLV